MVTISVNTIIWPANVQESIQNLMCIVSTRVYEYATDS